MLQQNEIPIVAEVVGTYGGDTSFLDQELDQRIANTLSEMQEKSAQIRTYEKEIGDLRENMGPIFGLAFIRRFSFDCVQQYLKQSC